MTSSKNIGTVLIVPPPQAGGGPTNAVLRVAARLAEQGAKITTNMFSGWHSALLNVGTGVRFDLLRLLRLGRRLVYRIDGCYSRKIFERQGRPWLTTYERINTRIVSALATADFVIYQSHFAKQHLDMLYERPTGTYDVVPNGVDLDLFSPTERSKDSLPTLGCIGKFRANRIEILTDISRHLPIQHRLLLVGRLDEQCRQDLETFRSSKPANCEVEYVSHVIGDEQLVKWHRQIDCFLHPVIGDTCSNAVIEALACGVPVVVPQWSGSSELVGKGGVIVEEPPWVDYQAFVQGFGEAAVEILEHQTEYSHLARERACETLDITDVARRYKAALGL
jgi:glycosyltransferase involved in cell wall biosynthesis